jgi:hypothetical protein
MISVGRLKLERSPNHVMSIPGNQAVKKMKSWSFDLAA